MTPQEAIQALERLGEEHEEHREADDILLQTLRTAGLGDVADAYERLKERVTFYYS